MSSSSLSEIVVADVTNYVFIHCAH